MKYHNYTSEEFAADEFFQQWILQPDINSNTYWENWLRQHPEKREAIEEARQIILMFGYQEEGLPYQRIFHMRKTIFEQVNFGKKTKHFGYRRKIAAIFVGLALALTMILMVWEFKGTKTYSTGYGEIQEFILPDSSVITLNANSTLSFKDFWSETGIREVWIGGEAFFKISRLDTLHIAKALKNHKAFIVHTENMDIEVLGTQFNVHTREKTSITLSSGEIALKLHKTPEKPMILLPGDKVTYDPAKDKLTKNQVKPEKYSAWRFQKLVFDKVTLREVAGTIKELYDISVKFEDPDLQEREFVGSVPSDNIEALIEAISRLYGVNAIRRGDTIIFQK